MNGAISRAAVRCEINVTPLVDVCLVLLIVFMVITPIVCGKTVVALPETWNPAAIRETSRQLTVAIREDGTVFVGPMLARPGELAGLLRSIRDADPDRPILVEGDRRLQYQEVVRLLATLSEAGFHRVGLITRIRL